MNLPIILNGEEEDLPGHYVLICPNCGRKTRLVGISVKNGKAIQKCTCNHKVNLVDLLDTPYLVKINNRGR
jgi:hypothetical protein